MRMTLQQVAEAVHGSLPNLAPLTSLEITGVSTDTRTVQPGDLFVALSGEHFDGHEYVAAAFDKGALAAVVQEGRVDSLPAYKGILIATPDTLMALGKIARAWRRNFDIPVVGVTGSVGKTTTKEMLAAALSVLGHVLKTEKNENNEIGVPQLLLRLTDEHKAVVVEMGMRGAGQIAYLAKVAGPTVGVITVIGENHIELLGSMDSIAHAKGELIEALPADGLAVLNADDPYTTLLVRKAKCRVAMFGSSETTTLRAENAKLDPGGAGWSACAVYKGQSGLLRVPSPSRHDIANALSAVLVAVELGAPLQKALDAVAEYKNVGMRMEILTAPNGATILSDCYNAAPASMRSALDTLASYPAKGRRIAFLGDMKELGSFARDMHAAVAQHAVELGIADIYAVGAVSSEQIERAERKFENSADAAAWAKENLNAAGGDVILVKGSRAMAMERIVEALISRP